MQTEICTICREQRNPTTATNPKQRICEMSLLAGIVQNKYRCLLHREFTEHVASERMRPVAVLCANKVLTFVTGRRIRFSNNDDK